MDVSHVLRLLRSVQDGLSTRNMRLLGVDVGLRRVGLARSDLAARIAFPAGCVSRPGHLLIGSATSRWMSGTLSNSDIMQFASAYKAIADRCRAEPTDVVVVGYPLQDDGTPGPACRSVGTFVDGLRRWCRATLPPVVFWDERCSTARVNADAWALGRRQSLVGDGHVDGAAAAMVLQSLLDAYHDGFYAGADEPDTVFTEHLDDALRERRRRLRQYKHDLD
ncbi:YqgF/RNase H-like domain-containing protein [Plasmodiophora brassicae]|uniref:YqgF/RNase H-like domain-containing protein n=1 Tax=Plasmodiophora brassicae TaxID=37360 RepID=A0A0G4J4S3_PLABS|nr:hypothetical protein PBRA_009101 [Plasmodiophora brassicae]SPR01730.1 unnamed protein product [Plasmodiophora brassicae]